MRRLLGQARGITRTLRRAIMPVHSFKNPRFPSYNHAPRKKTAALIGSLAGLLLLPAAGYAINSRLSNNEATHNSNSPSNSSNQGAGISDGSSTQQVLPSTATNSASTNVQTDTNQSSGSNAQTSLTINGQNVPVPANGSVHKTIVGNNSQTDVDVNVQNSGTATSQHSSTSLQVFSNSSSSGTNSDSRTNQEMQMRQDR